MYIILGIGSNCLPTQLSSISIYFTPAFSSSALRPWLLPFPPAQHVDDASYYSLLFSNACNLQTNTIVCHHVHHVIHLSDLTRITLIYVFSPSCSLYAHLPHSAMIYTAPNNDYTNNKRCTQEPVRPTKQTHVRDARETGRDSTGKMTPATPLLCQKMHAGIYGKGTKEIGCCDGQTVK